MHSQPPQNFYTLVNIPIQFNEQSTTSLPRTNKSKRKLKSGLSQSSRSLAPKLKLTRARYFSDFTLCNNFNACQTNTRQPTQLFTKFLSCELSYFTYLHKSSIGRQTFVFYSNWNSIHNVLQ